MSIEQKKKRAKITWITVVVLVILLEILQVNLMGKMHADPMIYYLETGNLFQRAIALLVMFALMSMSWFAFYTLLSIMIETAWRKLGKFLLVLITLIYPGIFIAEFVHFIF